LAENPVFATEEEEDEILSEESLEEKAYWSSQRIIPHIMGFEGLKLKKAASQRDTYIIQFFYSGCSAHYKTSRKSC